MSVGYAMMKIHFKETVRMAVDCIDFFYLCSIYENEKLTHFEQCCLVDRTIKKYRQDFDGFFNENKIEKMTA